MVHAIAANKVFEITNLPGSCIGSGFFGIFAAMPISKEDIQKRNLLTRAVREFFDSHGFLEVETPIMTPTVDPEVNLTPFETTLVSPSGEATPMYLVPSPEFQMKKLLGAGFGNIYTITKVFRNGEFGGGRHNPEFTMLEWYRENAGYFDIMKDCEDLIFHLTDGKIEKNWDRISVNELFIKNCGIDLLENKDFETFAKTSERAGVSVSACKTWDDIFYKIFLNKIEPDLGKNKPVFVYNYPASQGALAKKAADPFWVERFELYIAGQEICNAFSELLDHEEQRKRFENSLKERKEMGKTVFSIDNELLKSLGQINLPVGGNALGLDRLFMVLLDKGSIEDVLLFPLTKMLNK